MPSPAPVPQLPRPPVQDVLTGMETMETTMSAPAAGELEFAVDAARRVGVLARRLLSLTGRRPAPPPDV